MSTVTDYDGNSYTTVSINGVEWLATNLRTTHLSSGKAILRYDPSLFASTNGTGANFDLWYNGTTPMYAYPDNRSDLVSTYGLLYNYAAVATGLLRPSGSYYVATNAAYAALITYYTTAALAGAAMKETGTTHWLTPNTGATNSSSFTALPSGFYDRDGKYMAMHKTANFWAATASTASYFDEKSSVSYYLMNSSATLTASTEKISCGLSVRCIKT